MLTTVIIILREILEAVMLISLLAMLHLRLHFYRHWLSIAILSGIVGAYCYAKSLSDISGWFSGVGQEVVNGVSLLCIAVCLAIQLVLSSHLYVDHINGSVIKKQRSLALLTLSATLIIIIAIMREGAEIIVYFWSIQFHPGQFSSMVIGGIIGTGLGICAGIIFFVILYQLAINHLFLVISILLIIITSGVMMEAIRSFIQAGWIVAAEPIWNSSIIIQESSISGQLLYAIFFYEATPTAEEIIAWCATAFLLLCYVAGNYYYSNRAKVQQTI